jgi:hypothetical protein
MHAYTHTHTHTHTQTQERARLEAHTKQAVAKRRALREEVLIKEKESLQVERRDRLRAGFTNRSKFPLTLTAGNLTSRSAETSRFVSNTEDSDDVQAVGRPSAYVSVGSPQGRRDFRELHGSGAATARAVLQGTDGQIFD